MNANDKLAELIIQAMDTYATMPLVNGCRPELKYFIAGYLLANGVVVVDTNIVSPKNRPLISQCMGRPLDEIIELVHAKDEGRIVVQPCKVGDTVYVISESRVKEAEIDGILRRRNDTKIFVAFECDEEDCESCPFNAWQRSYCGEWDCDNAYGSAELAEEEFGKTVFLSRELAQEALEAKQNDKE